MTNPTPTDRAKALVSRLANQGGVVSADPAALEQMIATAIQEESNAQLLRDRAVDRQADVAAFVRKFGQARRETPGWPEHRDMDMRVRLIAEEFCEFLRDAGYEGNVWIARWNGEAEITKEIFDWHHDPETQDTIGERDFAKAADALIDMEYVVLGTHETMGINSTPLWKEVQKANMAKEGGATREDGKILKPAGWRPPDIASCLRAQGWSEGIEEVTELTPTERDDKGFGSTGR